MANRVVNTGKSRGSGQLRPGTALQGVLPARLLVALVAGLVAVLCAAPVVHAADAADPAVKVEFVATAHYSDAANTLGGRADDQLLDVLRVQIERSAAQCLSAGQTVLVRVLDVDLAGEVEPRWRRAATSVRVMREVGWPRIELAYTITRNGRPDGEVHDVVSDAAYLMRVGSTLDDGQRLPHERAMLARWVASTLCAPAKVSPG